MSLWWYGEKHERRDPSIEGFGFGDDDLALWEGSSTSTSNLPGIWGVDKLLEVRVLYVLAKARLLFLDLAAAELGWWL
ncbi:hypothetical protein SLE2022_345630 [Rubroshorea leprosula]